MKIFDRGTYKEAKYCKQCGKIFTIRKKWKDMYLFWGLCTKYSVKIKFYKLKMS